MRPRATRHGIIGTIVVGYGWHRGWINYLAVAPGWRQGGVGRALMVEAERLLHAVVFPKLNLQVRTRNAAVLAFYARLDPHSTTW